ncbi:Ras-related protein Rab-18-B [Halotydeus destructor]|nr:Ras-related protein Rab-18-B [Halotydeus destructor]
MERLNYLNRSITRVLLGTGLDLRTSNLQPSVRAAHAAEWASSRNISSSLQASVENGYNVKNAFEELVRRSSSFQEKKMILYGRTSGTVTKRISLKILFVGQSGVGKTSLILRATEKELDPQVTPTNGIELRKATIVVDDVEVKLNIWDTTGKDRLKSVLNNYYANADAAVLVYDVNSRDTLESLEYWAHDLELCCQNAQLVKLLLGNKRDLVVAKHVTHQEAQHWAESRQITNTFQTSAKEDLSPILQHLTKLTAKYRNAEHR